MSWNWVLDEIMYALSWIMLYQVIISKNTHRVWKTMNFRNWLDISISYALFSFYHSHNWIWPKFFSWELNIQAKWIEWNFNFQQFVLDDANLRCVSSTNCCVANWCMVGKKSYEFGNLELDAFRYSYSKQISNDFNGNDNNCNLAEVKVDDINVRWHTEMSVLRAAFYLRLSLKMKIPKIYRNSWAKASC